jgi:hypothetical protein
MLINNATTFSLGGSLVSLYCLFFIFYFFFWKLHFITGKFETVLSYCTYNFFAWCGKK